MEQDDVDGDLDHLNFETPHASYNVGKALLCKPPFDKDPFTS